VSMLNDLGGDPRAYGLWVAGIKHELFLVFEPVLIVLILKITIDNHFFYLFENTVLALGQNRIDVIRDASDPLRAGEHRHSLNSNDLHCLRNNEDFVIQTESSF